MKKIKNENTFLIIWCSCVVFLLTICLYGVNISFKGTSAYFGDGTTGSFTKYGVYYYSNYPEDTLEDVEPILDEQDNNWNRLLDNMFEVPSGYEFIGWKDEDGILYDPGYVQLLGSNLNMYAEWNLLPIEDTDDNVGGISYGDVNENGEIDENDYLLLENHISGTAVLEGQALKNADVNTDGKVDLIDVDIIKNAYLGTNGYAGVLPNGPILIYDIYEGSIDVGSGDGNIDSDGENNSGGGTSSGSTGNSNGSGGKGQGGSGNGTSGGNHSSDNTGSSNNKGDSSTDKETTNDEDKETPKVKKFEFKFMNGNIEFFTTSCETSTDTCELVFPKNNPARSGYSFKGWSINKDCSKDNIISASVIVDGSNTYYACYEDNDTEENGNKYYVWIIVFAISLFSIRLIWHLIYRFKRDGLINKDN